VRSRSTDQHGTSGLGDGAVLGGAAEMAVLGERSEAEITKLAEA